MKFSVVIPIKDEWDLVPKTLKTWLNLDSNDVILCFDKPAHQKTLRVVTMVAKMCGKLDVLRLLEVPRNPSYRRHQVWVRRYGFHQAQYDNILTGDIDISVNRNCLKAVRLVGNNNVGLASLQKFYFPHNIRQFYQLIVVTGLRWLAIMLGGRRFTGFTGLYAFYRPFWLETEREDDAQRLTSKKQWKESGYKDASNGIVAGEDVYLRDCMNEKYTVITLPDIGGISWRIDPIHSTRFAQDSKSHDAIRAGRSLVGAVLYSLTQLSPYYLVAFQRERRKLLAKK